MLIPVVLFSILDVKNTHDGILNLIESNIENISLHTLYVYVYHYILQQPEFF